MSFLLFRSNTELSSMSMKYLIFNREVVDSDRDEVSLINDEMFDELNCFCFDLDDYFDK